MECNDCHKQIFLPVDHTVVLDLRSRSIWCNECGGRLILANWPVSLKGDQMPTNEPWTAEALEERMREIWKLSEELIREEFRAGLTGLAEVGGQTAALSQFILISQNALGNAGDE